MSSAGAEGEWSPVEAVQEGPAGLTISVLESHRGQIVELPIHIQRNSAAIHGVDLVIAYDSAELAVSGDVVVLGPVAAGMLSAVNANTLGEIRIGLAGSDPLATDGELLSLTFEVLGSLSDPTPVSFESVSLDEGEVPVAAEDGAVQDTVAPSVEISPVDPDPRRADVDQISIQFSEPVSGFQRTDLTLRRDGGANLLTGSVSLTTDDQMHWVLAGLDGLSIPAGEYLLSLVAQGSGITDAAGRPLANDATEQWRNDSIWHNTRHPMDVNDDDNINAEDVVAIINDLNLNGSRVLSGSDSAPPPYVDVSDDGAASPIDVLLVINDVNLNGARPVSSGALLATMPQPTRAEGESRSLSLRPLTPRKEDTLKRELQRESRSLSSRPLTPVPPSGQPSLPHRVFSAAWFRDSIAHNASRDAADSAQTDLQQPSDGQDAWGGAFDLEGVLDDIGRAVSLGWQ